MFLDRCRVFGRGELSNVRKGRAIENATNSEREKTTSAKKKKLKVFPKFRKKKKMNVLTKVKKIGKASITSETNFEDSMMPISDSKQSTRPIVLTESKKSD